MGKVEISWADTNQARDAIAAELEAAASILRMDTNGNRYDSAAWRVADAGLKLRILMEQEGWQDAMGLNKPTGFGAKLPSR